MVDDVVRLQAAIQEETAKRRGAESALRDAYETIEKQRLAAQTQARLTESEVTQLRRAAEEASRRGFEQQRGAGRAHWRAAARKVKLSAGGAGSREAAGRAAGRAAMRAGDLADVDAALAAYESDRKAAVARLGFNSVVLGAVETLAPEGFRDAFFRTTAALGVAKMVFLDGATPKV